MIESFREEYQKWCTSPIFDEQTRRELCLLTDDIEIEDRFYKSLEFGTGGLRGLIGAGTNRMNIYTVGKATQGLADYINGQFPQGGKSAVIAYDSRNYSHEFALKTALVLAGNGIKAYLFESLRPTPELSFAVRALGCVAGVVITASHNPPAYNGYKVYWEDGGQIVPPHDKEIIACVNAVSGFDAIKSVEEEVALKKGLLKYIGEEMDEKYVAAVKKTVLNMEALYAMAPYMKIVYTPLHGTGNIPVRRVLRELGFSKVWVVPEQELPDGNFSTLEYPNPESPKAYTLALKLARKKDADIVLATDPDADRLGIYAKDSKTGEYMPFTGNMSGLLILEYRLSQLKEKDKLPVPAKNGAVVSTVVSSNMAQEIAKSYGVSYLETLTGFKYIGEQIKLFEDNKAANGGALDADKGAYEYLFGFEESYGCLVGDYARDKDAIAAVTSLCEAAAYYKRQGLTLCDQMRNIYEKYGYFKESLESVTLTGADGAERIQSLMTSLRDNPLSEIAGQKVVAVRDYQSGIRKEIESGEESQTGLPQSNVIYYELENGWCCARPSGTEPKIKFYFGVKGENLTEAEELLEKIQEELLALVFGEK